MDYLEKAALFQTKRKGSLIAITIVATICFVGIVLGVYSIFLKSYLFAALYFAAAVLGLGYVLIRINAITPAYVAADAEQLWIQRWKNGVFPYRVSFRPAFLADFIPDRVVQDHFLIRDVSAVYLGSRNFLARNMEGTDFETRLEEIGSHRRSDADVIRKMDFLCFLTKDGQLFFLPVLGMEPDALARVINLVHRKNEDAQIRCNLKEIRNRLTIQ